MIGHGLKYLLTSMYAEPNFVIGLINQTVTLTLILCVGHSKNLQQNFCYPLIIFLEVPLTFSMSSNPILRTMVQTIDQRTGAYQIFLISVINDKQ